MRKWMVALMVVLAIGLAGSVFWIMEKSDREGPEIIFDKDKNDIYEDGMDNTELLEDVKAIDKKDGNVSDTLTVEAVYEKDNGNEVLVIFVAKDSSNNVTKSEYTMTKKGTSEEEEEDKPFEYEPEEKEDSTEPEAEPETAGPEAVEPEAAGSEAEPVSAATDLDEKLPDITQSADAANKEEQAKEVQEAKIEKLNPQDPRIYLTKYYLETSVGTRIDKISYVADIKDDVDETNALWRGIQIDGTLDVNTPGTYELTYFVVDSDGNVSNGAVLTVVVE